MVQPPPPYPHPLKKYTAPTVFLTELMLQLVQSRYWKANLGNSNYNSNNNNNNRSQRSLAKDTDGRVTNVEISRETLILQNALQDNMKMKRRRWC